MAVTETIKVSKKGFDQIEVSYPLPESLEDPRWAELVEDPSGDVNSLAVAQFRVRLQASGRNQIEDGAEAVQQAMQEFTYSRRTGSTGGGRKKKARLSASVVKENKFSKAQLEALRAAGLEIEGMDGE